MAWSQTASGEGVPSEMLSVQPGWNPDAFQPHDAELAFAFNRPLRDADGRIAVLVGHTDVTALAKVSTGQLRVPLGREPFRGGALEVQVWRVDAGGSWHELGRFPLRRLTRTGFEQATVSPRLDVQSDGQVDAAPGGGDVTGRGATFQDVTASGGGEGVLRRSEWEVGWQGIVAGASHTPARLRAAQLGSRAPALDLASYHVRLVRRGLTVSAGHVALGTHRLLASQFRSRGVSANLALGRRVTMEVGSVAATEVVGWSDPFGLARPAHRVMTATVGFDVAPARLGTLRLEVNGIGGSVQPLAAFNGQSVNDREESSGIGAQITAADPTQRVRLTAGWARSRFDNPSDPALSGDSALVRVQEERRAARFGELTVDALRGARLGAIPATLSIAVRHERTDPLYRSVAAFVQADRDQSTVEATGSLGPVQWQASVGRGRDNLDDIPSLLTTRSRNAGVMGSVPVAALLGASAARWWWPTLSAAWQGARQQGDAIPENGGFRDASQVPDQYAADFTGNATWQHARWSAAYRFSRSRLDNRQPQREQADFTAVIHGVTLGWTAHERLGLAVDLGHEDQHSAETGARATNRRAGAQADWRPFGRTALAGAASLVQTSDESSTQRGRNLETRLELSQGFDVWTRRPDDTQARAFVRWARTGTALRLAGAVQPGLTQWTVNAGVSLRVF
jgi:hypothetical protein